MKLDRYNGSKQKSNSLVGLIPKRQVRLINLEKDLLLLSNLHSHLSQKKEEALINLSSLESNIHLINEVDYILESKTNKLKTLVMFSFLGLRYTPERLLSICDCNFIMLNKMNIIEYDRYFMFFY